MMLGDPLEQWLVWWQWDIDPQQVADAQEKAHAALIQLARFLKQEPSKRADMRDAIRMTWGVSMIGLHPQDLDLAHRLYRRVFERGGLGSSRVQELLLNTIAVTEDVRSIPFWLAILDLKKPREQFIKQRRTIALAALARLAINRDAPEAYEALRQATRHADPAVRALAIHYLSRAYLEAERPLPEEVLEELGRTAVEDSAFGPRFQARAVLRSAGRPVPLDNPKGVYAFKVRLKRYKGMYRTIELRSEQTLDDLHYAIQGAIGWDADHLYSFFMNGQRLDDQYAFACPYEEDRPPWTDQAVIGELGLVLGHTFLYYFDYGDNHEFEVKVVRISPEAERGKYPRVVESRGEAPLQYG